MYLHRLDLCGFKSFHEKTSLEFGPGIAAIIGPNGCGKSNLVDAMRWVLGEQSTRLLRGTKMDELIFAGTEKRQPLNFAEVSLTLSEVGSRLKVDYDQVTITRRLYRSGESEYYINRAQCRLKDITELLLDTGAGRDFYSVIGQGRIEEIINSRAEDRREIFEEAAGILKYKLRKREAQRRLEETRENMLRVRDLLLELGGRVEPLREQAGLARKYRSLQEKLHTVERGLFSHHLARGKAALSQKEQQLQEAGGALAGLRAAEGEAEARLLDLKQRQQRQAALQDQQERELNRLLRETEQVEGKLKVLQERAGHVRQQRADLEHRRAERGQRVKQLREERERLQKELAANGAASSAAGERRRLLEHGRSDGERSSIVDAVEQRQRDLHLVSSAAAALEATAAELQRQIDQLSRRPPALEHEMEGLAEQTRLAAQKRAALRQEMPAVTAALKEKEAVLKRDGTEDRAVREELESSLQRERELDRKLRSNESRLQLLQEQESERSGYYRGVREIMQALRRGEPALAGVVGPVVDLITVPAGYTRAIEAALGGGLQDIVTETEEAARRGITYLKRFRLGWATFLPLDTLRLFPNALDRYPRWKEIEGALGKASELLQVKPLYRKAVDYLAATTAVVRDLETASRVAREIKYSCRIVTVEGDLVNPGGALRGGSLSRGGAGMPLGRKQEIAALELAQAALTEKLVASDRQRAALQKRLDRIEAERLIVEKSRREMHARRERNGRDYRDYYREEQRLRESLNRVTAILVKAQQERTALQERLQEKKHLGGLKREETARLTEELAGMEEQYRRSLDEREKLEQELTNILLELNSLREQKRALKKELDRLEKEWETVRQEERLLEQEMLRLERSSASFVQEQEQLQVTQAGLQEKCAAVVAVAEAKKQAVSLAVAALAAAEEEDRLRRVRLTRLERRERHLAVEESRLRAEADFWKQRYHDRCGSRPPVEPDPDFQPVDAENRIALLKADLEAMGEVNLGAIEELARLEDRLQFLEGQLQDLQKGEQSLQQVLSKIDGSMERSFSATFNLIRESFQVVFTELFEGGRAVLKLSDPEDILGSGIEIGAQPPGKKLQNISLLSAGEKVLTALALTFAILRHNPAPFYLLDEVESALDEANLARFARFLERASHEAQLIMITHRRQTMELAGVIYGVTMSEPGVSRLVSVRREELAG